MDGALAFDLEAWVSSCTEAPPIVHAGADVLRRRAAEVSSELLGSTALRRLVEIMIDVMRAAPGVGLAAPQIGVPLRVFVAEDTEDRMGHVPEAARAVRGRVALPTLALVNPRVTAVASDVATFYEGCLSVPGYGALVRRAASVRVTAGDVDGNPVEACFEGWPARIMQHEMDHLDGTLYVDKMIARSFATGDNLARLGAASVDEVLRSLEPQGQA
jgi:peptide deformylase